MTYLPILLTIRRQLHKNEQSDKQTHTEMNLCVLLRVYICILRASGSEPSDMWLCNNSNEMAMNPRNLISIVNRCREALNLPMIAHAAGLPLFIIYLQVYVCMYVWRCLTNKCYLYYLCIYAGNTTTTNTNTLSNQFANRLDKTVAEGMLSRKSAFGPHSSILVTYVCVRSVY